MEKELKNYVFRKRKGKVILVHKQIIRWRNRRAREALKLKKAPEREARAKQKEQAHLPEEITGRDLLKKNIFE